MQDARRWLWLGLVVPLLMWGCPPQYIGDDDDNDDNDDNDTGDDDTGDDDTGDDDTGDDDTGDDDTGDDDSGDDDTGDDDTGSNQYGPPNAWWHADVDDVPPNLAGTGQSNGDIAHNFVLTDQNGDQVELYQFFGQVVVIDVFAYW